MRAGRESQQVLKLQLARGLLMEEPRAKRGARRVRRTERETRACGAPPNKPAPPERGAAPLSLSRLPSVLIHPCAWPPLGRKCDARFLDCVSISLCCTIVFWYSRMAAALRSSPIVGAF